MQRLVKWEGLRANLTEFGPGSLLNWNGARPARSPRRPYQPVPSRRRTGSTSETTMINANLRLVVSIKGINIGVLLPRIQEGILLTRAVRLDPEKGFVTYAIWWVKQAVMRAIADQSRTIRLPVVHDQLQSLKKAARDITRRPVATQGRGVGRAVGSDLSKLRSCGGASIRRPWTRPFRVWKRFGSGTGGSGSEQGGRRHLRPRPRLTRELRLVLYSRTSTACCARSVR